MSGLCECGCGKPTRIAIKTNTRQGDVAGKPRRYLLGHGTKPRHGHARSGVARSDSPTYRSWRHMLYRCTKPSCHAYARYGGRGIRVCERWLHSFENFLEDMGERPPGKSLDRFPNPNGNYEPGNCRWATAKEQRANQCGSRPTP